MIATPTAFRFAVAGIALAVELPAGDHRIPLIASALRPFQVGDADHPAARLLVHRGEPPAGLLAHPLQTPVGTIGMALLEREGVQVWGGGLGAPFAGIRLLLATVFAPPRYLLVHGVGLELGGQGLLATGPSGAGKSTLCGLFQEAASFSDEMILLETGTEPKIHATPIRSSCERPPVGGSAPLIALLALEKAAESALRPLRGVDALGLLLEQTFEHPERDLVATFAGAASVVEAVERRILSFRKDRSCVPLLRGLLGC